MEIIQVYRRRKASKFAPEDFLSKMPDIVITNILDRLPIQDAVSTSVLAREWRYKWTMVSQLVFDRDFFLYLVKRKRRNNYGRIIGSLLLQLKGTITKFFLYTEERSKLDDEEINDWILLLSTKGIKDLTLQKWNGPPLKLPTHIFSCLELKHLMLHVCSVNPPSSSHGFPNLLTLNLSMHSMLQNKSKFGELFTMCPLLQTLRINIWSLDKLKLVEIAKLANLKILSLSLSNLDAVTSTSGIFKLVGLLPKLEELALDFVKCTFIEDGDRKRSPTSFPCLKVLELNHIDLDNRIKLSCAFELIRCSPNLQTLEISTHESDPSPGIPEVDFNKLEPLHLQSVRFVSLEGSENKAWLIKYLLACSPFLKNILIIICLPRETDERLVFARKIKKFHRASPVVDISFRG